MESAPPALPLRGKGKKRSAVFANGRAPGLQQEGTLRFVLRVVGAAATLIRAPTGEVDSSGWPGMAMMMMMMMMIGFSVLCPNTLDDNNNNSPASLDLYPPSKTLVGVGVASASDWAKKKLQCKWDVSQA